MGRERAREGDDYFSLLCICFTCYQVETHQKGKISKRCAHPPKNCREEGNLRAQAGAPLVLRTEGALGGRRTSAGAAGPSADTAHASATWRVSAFGRHLPGRPTVRKDRLPASRRHRPSRGAGTPNWNAEWALLTGWAPRSHREGWLCRFAVQAAAVHPVRLRADVLMAVELINFLKLRNGAAFGI